MTDTPKRQVVRTQDSSGNDKEVEILGRKGDALGKGVKQVGGQHVKGVKTVSQGRKPS